ncbi:FAD-dependent oxidoreductase [Ochrobactrum sp. Q0168]|uniref:FAD-dependent oxidoreductase n=1 Tax=Ochrobactrum sp. Q0168 TaxID=2793241 RepID=UPI0018EAF150|nr:FAD-dependent oxidoreductase [Ochrobactrum sp. Q0168]
MNALDDEFDVVVLGSGAAGLTTATVAAHLGMKVLLAEKEHQFGGSTALSGGVVWIPNNPEMHKLGMSDSVEAARSYLTKVLGNKIRYDLVDAFLANGPDMVTFMHKHTELRLISRPIAPDYYPELDGASPGGRALDPQIFDGRRLGKLFSRLRWPIKEFLVFGGMMVGRREIDQLLGSMRSPQNFAVSAKMILQFLAQKLSHGRGTRLIAGNSLAAQLLKSASDAGVELRNEVQIDALESESGRINAVRVTYGGKQQVWRAKLGIVLAGGGSAANLKTMSEILQTPEQHYTMAPKSSTGGLQKLAVLHGAVIDDAVVDPANFSPVSVMKDAGKEIRFPHLFLDRAKPGLIAVNQAGRRFVDEASSYHQFVQGMLADSSLSVPAWLVCDARFLRKYGMGLVRPGIGSRKRFLDTKYLMTGKTIAELAQAIGVPAGPLESEIEKHNRYAIDGHDPDFGKGSNIYDRHLGDAANGPNPCLGPISAAPFYAIKVYPGDIGSTQGLRTDANARVLNADGHPINGLYACGNDMNSVMAGTYPGAGITLGPALTFGYIIANTLNRERQNKPQI